MVASVQESYVVFVVSLYLRQVGAQPDGFVGYDFKLVDAVLLGHVGAFSERNGQCFYYFLAARCGVEGYFVAFAGFELYAWRDKPVGSGKLVVVVPAHCALW